MNQAAVHTLSSAFRGEQLKPTVILLTAPMLLVWKCFGSPEFYLSWLAPRFEWGCDPMVAATVYHFLSCFCLFAVIPALIVKIVFRERLADYGAQIGDRVRLVRSLLIIAPGVVFVAYFGSKSSALADEYPMNPNAGTSPTMFGVHACLYSLYFVGWEFYFRGFLQCGLRGKLGDVNALGIQVVASVLLHIGKPWIETFGSIAGGLLWGVLVFRTRSLLSGFLQHLLLGLSLDYFVCYM